jgi:CHAT domain-containing protein
VVAVTVSAALERLPWAALVTRSNRYWIEDVALVNGIEAAPRRSSEAVLVIAAPDSSAESPRRALPLAVAEARQIAAAHQHVQVIDGERVADKRDLLLAISRHQLIHFAGHAVVDLERPERSLLLIRSTAMPVVVTAEELSALQLHESIVVLTACHTAFSAASGVPSPTLAKVLLAAGARATVATLGAVSDSTAALIGARLHGHLAEGMLLDEALRQSQLDAIRSGAAADWALFGVFTNH